MGPEGWPQWNDIRETARPMVVPEKACYVPARSPFLEEADQVQERSEADKLLADIGYAPTLIPWADQTETVRPSAQYPQLHSDVLATKEAEKPLFERLSNVIQGVRGKVGDIVESAIDRVSRVIETVADTGVEVKESLSVLITSLIKQRDYTSVRNMGSFFRQYGPQFMQIAEKWGQDPVKLCALIAGESKFSSTVRNPTTNAHGLGQMTPDAWKDACKQARQNFQRSNPLHQIEATCAYMQMIEKQWEKRGQSLNLLDTSALYHRWPYVKQEWPVSSAVLRGNEAIATPYKALVEHGAPATNATYLAASVLFYFWGSLPKAEILESTFVQEALWATKDADQALSSALQSVFRQKTGRRA